jgi:hypothetical protein
MVVFQTILSLPSHICITRCPSSTVELEEQCRRARPQRGEEQASGTLLLHNSPPATAEGWSCSSSRPFHDVRGACLFRRCNNRSTSIAAATAVQRTRARAAALHFASPRGGVRLLPSLVLLSQSPMLFTTRFLASFLSRVWPASVVRVWPAAGNRRVLRRRQLVGV